MGIDEPRENIWALRKTKTIQTYSETSELKKQLEIKNKKQFVYFLVGGLQLARIDLSRRGGIDRTRPEFGELRETRISNKLKTFKKISKSTPHSYQHLLASI